MGVFDILQLIGGSIMGIANIPQLIQVIKTKKARDLNLKSFLLLSIGAILMEIYAINLVLSKHAGQAFLITNTLSVVIILLLSSCIIYVKIYKGKRKI